MFPSSSEYDRSVNMFSPDGRLLQVEYATEAVKLGSSAIAILCDEGVVFAVEKRISSDLLVPRTEKVFEIDDHIGVVMAGLVADARTMVNHMRTEAQNHRFSYDEPISVRLVTQHVCDLALSFGERGKSGESKQMSRPFGTALLVAGIEDGKPKLFHTDPSGTYTQCRARAIGGGGEGAEHYLREHYRNNMTLAESSTLALETLRMVMPDRLTEKNVEIACAKVETGKFYIYELEERKAVVDTLSPQAT